MKVKLLTCVSDINHPGLAKFRHSLDKFKWDYHIIHDPNIGWDWGGWDNFYNWAKAEAEKPDGYTHVILSDGFDVVALGDMQEVIEKYKKICGGEKGFLVSTEKAAFPVFDLHYRREDYPTPTRWPYINCGGLMTDLESLFKIYHESDRSIVSQLWFHKRYLYQNQDETLKLDVNCEIFQTLAFKDDTDFTTENERLINNHTQTQPVLAHGNGKVDMQFVYDIYGL